MKGCNSSGKKVTTVCLFFFLMLVLFLASDVFALPIKTVDSEGQPVNFEKEVKDNPDFFLERIKVDLRQGNLDSVGFLANILLNLQPQNSDVRAMYAVFLASKENIVKAIQELDRAVQAQRENIYTHIARAMILRLQKKYEAAILQCKKAVLVDKTHPYPWNVLGRIYFDQQDYGLAQTSFQKAVDLESKFAPACANLGAAAFMQGDMSVAVSSFQRAISLNPESFTSHFGLATVYEVIGDNVKAVEEFQKVFKLKPDDSTILLKLGELQLKTGRYTDAFVSGKEMERRGMQQAYVILADAALHLGQAQKTLQSLDKAPPTDRTYYIQGFAFMMEKQYKDALDAMNAALHENKQHFGAYTARMALKFYLGDQVDPDEELKGGWGESLERLIDFIKGNILASQEKWNEAEKKWNSAESLIPGFSINGLRQDTLKNGMKKEEFKFLNLGILYYFRNLPAYALAEFDNALQRNNDSILANYWAAQVYLKMGEREKAVESYKHAIEKAPSFFSALYAIGELEFLLGHPDVTVNYYEQALKVKKDAGILIKLGLLYEDSQQYQMAEEKYAMVVESFPDLFVGYNQLAWLYAKRGEKLDKALLLAEKADKLQPGNASILDTIGWILYQNKELDNSQKYLKQSLDVMPNDPTVLYHLASVQYAMGKMVEARESLEQALLISKNFEELDEAKSLLNKMQVR